MEGWWLTSTCAEKYKLQIVGPAIGRLPAQLHPCAFPATSLDLHTITFTELHDSSVEGFVEGCWSLLVFPPVHNWTHNLYIFWCFSDLQIIIHHKQVSSMVDDYWPLLLRPYWEGLPLSTVFLGMYFHFFLFFKYTTRAIMMRWIQWESRQW